MPDKSINSTILFFAQILSQSAKHFVQQENTMENTYQNLKKMELLRQHMGYQCNSIIENTQKIDYLKEQVHAMERWCTQHLMIVTLANLLE